MPLVLVSTSPAPTTNGDAEIVPIGYDLLVNPGVTIVDEDSASAYAAIVDNGDSRLTIDGAISGYAGIVIAQTLAANYAYLTIASTGSVQAFGGGYDVAIDVQTGQFEIVNNGAIQGASYLDENALTAVAGSGGGTFDNNGTITTINNAIVNTSASGSTEYIDNTGVIIATGGVSYSAKAIFDTGGHTVYLDNSGTISDSGNGTAIYTDAVTTEYFTNSGHIVGDVDLSDTASTFSSSGIIDGAVNFAGSSFIDNGTINGIVNLPGQPSVIANVTVGASAVISSGTPLGYALRVNQGPFYVDNSGYVGGLALDYTASPSANTSGQGIVVNHGTIATQYNYFSAVYLGDAAASDIDTVDNYGGIAGDQNGAFSSGVRDGGSNTLDLVNTGTITGNQGVVMFWGSGDIVNSGGITGLTVGVESNAGTGLVNYVFNSGDISASSNAVYDSGAHFAHIVNTGTISAGADDAIFASSVTQERLVNSGTISGLVSLAAASSTIVNSGAIDGDVTFGGVAGRFVNSGSVDGNISFTGAGNVYLGKGGSFTGTLTGTGADGRYYAGAGVDNFDLTAAGAAAAVGGSGETTFDYGATFTNSMTVQGGSGTTIVKLTGNYIGNAGPGNSGAIFLGARTMVGVDKVVFGAGAFSYSLSVNAATVQNGATMTVDASAVAAGQTATLNISKDVGGFYDFIGGAGVNTIICAASNLFANDVFIGGSNTSNAINFKTAGTVLSAAFANISGFNVINLVSGTNDIQLNDFMVTKANNHTVVVNASYGADTIDSSLLITNSNSVIVNALNSSGGDTFVFGAAKETVNLGAGISTSVNYDTIANFTFGTTLLADNLTVQGYTPNAIDASVSGSLSTASFDADLATALAGHLNNGDALLFTANAGTLAGDTFLIASTNGSAGYAAGDLVVRLTGTTTGTLATANV